MKNVHSMRKMERRVMLSLVVHRIE